MSNMERFQDVCDNHNDVYLSYESDIYRLHIGLNINHGCEDAVFEGTLEEVLTNAENYDEYGEEQ